MKIGYARVSTQDQNQWDDLPELTQDELERQRREFISAWTKMTGPVRAGLELEINAWLEGNFLDRGIVCRLDQQELY